MNNTPTNGVYPPPFGGYSALVVQKVKAKYEPNSQQIYGLTPSRRTPSPSSTP